MTSGSFRWPWPCKINKQSMSVCLICTTRLLWCDQCDCEWCDQCDSAFCSLQLTALIKPNWCVLLYCCACLYPIQTILVQTGWTTVPCPATNLSMLICKLSARIKQSVISVAFETPPETGLGICVYKTSLLHRADDYIAVVLKLFVTAHHLVFFYVGMYHLVSEEYDLLKCT